MGPADEHKRPLALLRPGEVGLRAIHRIQPACSRVGYSSNGGPLEESLQRCNKRRATRECYRAGPRHSA